MHETLIGHVTTLAIEKELPADFSVPLDVFPFGAVAENLVHVCSPRQLLCVLAHGCEVIVAVAPLSLSRSDTQNLPGKGRPPSQALRQPLPSWAREALWFCSWRWKVS